ncbi:MAG: tyrosine/phenylalanine carboxypeptidase domain-containing protein, partial [Polyangiaceae bacterium]
MAERRAREAEESVDKAAPRASANGEGSSPAPPVAPSIPAPPAAGPWRSYKEVVATLAGRIVEAQRPIRVLQALRWDDEVEHHFLRSRPRELPKIDAAFYEKLELGFHPKEKEREFEQIARDIDRDLGEADAVGHIMMTTALEYRDVVRMLSARGTPAFYAWSRKLYGSPKDKFPDGRSTVRDLGRLLYGILTNVDEWS